MPGLRVDFITNQAPHYRAALWNGLLQEVSLDIQFLYGEDATQSIRSIDLSEPRWQKMRARFHRVRNVYVRRILIWQRGVLNHVRKTDAQALVLLGQMYVVSMWLTVWLARRRGMSVLFWGHGAYGREGRLKRWIRNQFLSLADGVLVYGEYARQLLIEDGFQPDRIRVVYNSLDHSRQLALRDSLVQPDFLVGRRWFHQAAVPTLLFVGRLTPQKSIDRLIDAVANLRDEGRVFNLLVVGDGPELEHLRTLGVDLEGQVHFYGACYDEEELGRLIANADLCVSPGEVGLTAIHSMGYGTPVCTHDDMRFQGPEAESVIDGETGVVFDRNTHDIAGAIKRWFDYGLDRERVRNACYEMIDGKWNTQNQLAAIREALIQFNSHRRLS